MGLLPTTWSGPGDPWRRDTVPLLAAVIGACYTLTFLDFAFIVGRGAYWTEPFGDRITHLIGATYFVRDHWRFPIFFVPHLGFPEGTNIVFTDSLPLIALGAKLVYMTTGWWGNYFGLWLFACFPLLAFFMAKATRELGGVDGIAMVGAALLALMSPAFLARLGHTALMGHFLIAWSFYLYARIRANPGRNADLAQFALVASASMLLQAYFLPIVMLFLAAALAQESIERRCSLARAALSLGAVSGTVIAVAWIAGIIGRGSMAVSMGGFGYYSMNLLSPFLPPREHLPEIVSGLVTWDGRGYTWDANGGQYEGYNYLGAGVIALLALHLIASRRILKSALRRHLVLSLALLALTAYAVSSRVYLGNHLLLDIHLPSVAAKITSQFRTGGRYFWPVYYVLILALVVATFRRFDRRAASWIIVLAVGGQAAETQFLRREISHETSGGYPQVLDRAAWTRLIQAHEYIEQYPSFQCGGWLGQWPDNNANMEFHSLAAELGKPINSVYVARIVRDCRAETEKGLEFNIRPGGLYIFAGEFPVGRIAAAPAFAELCRAFNWGVACSRAWDSLRDPALRVHFRSVSPGEALLRKGVGELPPRPKEAFSRYNTGELLRFDGGGNGNRHLGWGWFNPEGWGTWSRGSASEISFQLREPFPESLELIVHAQAFVHPGRPVAEVDVYANGRSIARWEFRWGQGIAERSAIVPRTLMREDGTLQLGFVPSEVQSPKDAGLSEDERKLGIGLVDLRLVPRSGGT